MQNLVFLIKIVISIYNIVSGKAGIGLSHKIDSNSAYCQNLKSVTQGEKIP